MTPATAPLSIEGPRRNGASYRSGDFARIIGDKTQHQETWPYSLATTGNPLRVE